MSTCVCHLCFSTIKFYMSAFILNPFGHIVVLLCVCHVCWGTIKFYMSAFILNPFGTSLCCFVCAICVRMCLFCLTLKVGNL